MKGIKDFKQVIHIEVEGNEIETALRKLPNIESINRGDPEGDREKYTISSSGEQDLRPEIFNLAKKQKWVLWELREGQARLEEFATNIPQVNSEGHLERR